MLPTLQRAVKHPTMIEGLADILSTLAVEVKYRVECGKYARSERIATASAAAMQAALTSGHPREASGIQPPSKTMFRRARRDSPARSSSKNALSRTIRRLESLAHVGQKVLYDSPASSMCRDCASERVGVAGGH